MFGALRSCAFLLELWKGNCDWVNILRRYYCAIISHSFMCHIMTPGRGATGSIRSSIRSRGTRSTTLCPMPQLNLCFIVIFCLTFKWNRLLKKARFVHAGTVEVFNQINSSRSCKFFYIWISNILAKKCLMFLIFNIFHLIQLFKKQMCEKFVFSDPISSILLILSSINWACLNVLKFLVCFISTFWRKISFQNHLNR